MHNENRDLADHGNKIGTDLGNNCGRFLYGAAHEWPNHGASPN